MTNLLVASKYYPILTLEYMTKQREGQYFDRKSAQIKPIDIAPLISAFANAEGGTIALGISDKNRRVEGIIAQGDAKINQFVSAPKECCHPMPEHQTELLDIINDAGKKDQLLLIHIKPSVSQIVYTSSDAVFLRIGDKTKEMKGDDLRNLEYAKGSRHWEDEFNLQATIDDLDPAVLSQYKHKIGADHIPTDQVLRSRNLLSVKDGKQVLTNAAVLLFAKQISMFYPHCIVRFLRYEGTEARPGRRFNVVKDKQMEDSLIKLIPQVQSFVSTQLREFTKLTAGAIFETQPEYPDFAWQESLANAVAHRIWGLYGDYIRISMFDDRLEIFSPGKLPNIVTVDNIKETRFARNPNICNVLNSFKIVKQLNEGVMRMYEEMEDLNLPDPEIKETAGGVTVILRNNIANRTYIETEKSGNGTVNGTVKLNDGTVNGTVKVDDGTEKQNTLISFIEDNPFATIDAIASSLSISRRTCIRWINNLKEQGILIRVGSDKSGHWEIKSK